MSRKEKRFQRGSKRGVDLVLSLAGLTLLVIPFVVIALAIKLDSKGPVLFRQERVGKAMICRVHGAESCILFLP